MNEEVNLYSTGYTGYTGDLDIEYIRNMYEDRLRTISGQDNSEALIKQYDDKSYKINFIKSGHYKKVEEELFIGFEIEFELPPSYNSEKKHNIVAKHIKDNFSDFIAECKHDGSLINGFEAVSHPTHIGLLFTKKFKKRLTALFDYLKSINAQVCQTTGLHFHVSNKYLQQDTNSPRDVQERICLICNTLCDELKYLSGRYEAAPYKDLYGEAIDRNGDFVYPKGNLFNYCKFDEGEYGLSLDSIHNSLPRGHRCAINCGNNSTTEFRFFAGTLDYTQFIEDVSLVIGICRMAIYWKHPSLVQLNDLLPVKINRLSTLKNKDIINYTLCNDKDVEYIRSKIKYKYDKYKSIYDMCINVITSLGYKAQSNILRDMSYMTSSLGSNNLYGAIDNYEQLNSNLLYYLNRRQSNDEWDDISLPDEDLNILQKLYIDTQKIIRDI